jgi:hypothetical protein
VERETLKQVANDVAGLRSGGVSVRFRSGRAVARHRFSEMQKNHTPVAAGRRATVRQMRILIVA